MLFAAARVTARPQLAKADTAFQGASVGQPTEPCFSVTTPRAPGTASLAGFFDLSHVFDGPLRYGASVRFDTDD